MTRAPLAVMALSHALAACQPATVGAGMSEIRITPQTPVNRSGPLAVPLFETPAGAWLLSGANGACPLILEPSVEASGGAVIWPECAALDFSAARWTFDGAGLAFWSREGERVAMFRTDMLPPLSGEDAEGARLTLSRR